MIRRTVAAYVQIFLLGHAVFFMKSNFKIGKGRPFMPSGKHFSLLYSPLLKSITCRAYILLQKSILYGGSVTLPIYTQQRHIKKLPECIQPRLVVKHNTWPENNNEKHFSSIYMLWMVEEKAYRGKVWIV